MKILEDLRDNKKRDWRWRFLSKLAETCSVTDACLFVKRSRDTAYKHKSRFPRFAEKWEEALETGVELLESTIRKRALDPNDKSGHLLAMFLLKAHRPEKYRDYFTGQVSVTSEEPNINPAAAAAALKAARETIENQGAPQHTTDDA